MQGIDIVEPVFNSFVLPNAVLETLAGGFRLLEGPVWFADHQCLLVSDVPNNRIVRWTDSGGASVFREPSDYANGHTRDALEHPTYQQVLRNALLWCARREQ